VKALAGNLNSPPSREVVEISIFGPGIGECIVIHLTENEWMIVDSCLDRKARLPVALQYLNDLGVNPATNVKLFVVTHWHDDHISGASEVLAACQNARFVCSNALGRKEFFKFVKLYTQRGFLKDTGVDEFDNIFQILKERLAAGKSTLSEPGWTVADKRLLYFPQGGRIAGTEVFALSPSDAEITLSLKEIVDQLTPKPKTPKRRAIAQGPNHVAVALWVTVGNVHLLLGSDLENYKDDRLGWKAILLSSARPRGRAVVVKVPHHGSSNAYCKGMWQDMVSLDNPIALLTQYASGVKPLPSEADIARIKIHTSKMYCTGSPSGTAPVRRDPAVEKTLREIVRTRCTVIGPMGHIRVRIPINGSVENFTVELFNGAGQL
jgi:hypothetical protein